MRFALDTPVGRDVGRIVRFSGWCLTDNGLPVERIYLRVNGRPIVQLERMPRHDLTLAFPKFPEASQGGFGGDLPLPEWLVLGGRLAIEVVAQSGSDKQSLTTTICRLAGDEPTFTPRLRTYRFEDVLERMPAANFWGTKAVSPMTSEIGTWPAMLLNTPHFHDVGTTPTVRVLDAGPTNAYSSGALSLIDATPVPKIFLDLGCGIRRAQDMRKNGIYLDAVHFRGVDLVSTQTRLPLRDASVDTIVSLNVFEHLPDPFSMAKELHRVLKPGGSIWVETAFMQPLHADPGHYFNMTLEGLMRTFVAFEIDESGVLPHHLPSQSLRMQLDHALPHMCDGDWKRALTRLLGRLHADGEALDEALGPVGRRTLAAGVYFRGRKSV